MALVVAIVLGVLGMHALTPSAPLESHGVSGHEAVVTDHPDCNRASRPDQTPCPDDTDGHPGPMCQAGAVAFALILPVPFGAGMPVAATTPRLTATVVEDAAHGAGCGPPSLTKLSISRT
jgi:hypothetical protein